MDKFKIMSNRLEKQRSLLEYCVKQKNNLCDAEVINKSKELDISINEYIKAKEIDK